MLTSRREDRVLILTIDRPDRRNAISKELVVSLREALVRCDEDPEVSVVVLTGAPPGFCAGSDLKELATMDLAGMCQHEAESAALARLIGLIDKPVVAAVDGFALGGGFVLAISCDVVVTGRAARWHLPEVSIGWIPPWGLETLAARVGPVAARRLTWGAESIDGIEAHRLGLADVLADGAALAEATAVAQRLVKLPAPAVAATKRYFSQSIGTAGEARDTLANRMFAENCRYEVAKATLTRFGMKA